MDPKNEIEMRVCSALLCELISHAPLVGFSIGEREGKHTVSAAIPGRWSALANRPTVREALSVVVDSLRKHDGRPSLAEDAQGMVDHHNAASLLTVVDRCPRCGDSTGYATFRKVRVVFDWKHGERLGAAGMRELNPPLQPGELGACVSCGGYVKVMTLPEQLHAGLLGPLEEPEPEACDICGETGGEHNSRCHNLGKK